MESPNADKLKLLIGFLRFDADNEGKKAGLQNVEIAAADFLNEYFSLAVSKADIYDEADEQARADKEMRA